MAFLLDLDGTLVDTDPIYIHVWGKLLGKYNLDVDENFFNTFIRGKSDDTFLKYLVKDISISDIKSVSLEKDRLFADYLHDNKPDIMFGGVYEYLDSIKDHKIAIVTSSNRSSAERILKYTDLYKFVNLLVASEDTIHHKPHPEPYMSAAKELGMQTKECTAFEDSMTGYLSAKKSGVGAICLYDNGKNACVMENAIGLKFTSYGSLSVADMSGGGIESEVTHNGAIMKALAGLPIKSIYKSNENIKTGYICDIDLYNLTYNDGSTEDIILKISNHGNELSKVATRLNMYNNELYFYDSIATRVPGLKVPRCYGTFKDGEKVGIVLENLSKCNGSFGVDLNGNIRQLLSVVSAAHSMHTNFYFDGADCIPPQMVDLKRVNEITYYSELVSERFDRFIAKCTPLLTDDEVKILSTINGSFSEILKKNSKFPLCFCHGDLKSPNIYYRKDTEPYFLDWQYVHINKGISDIVFLLVESVDFEPSVVTIVEQYYYRLLVESGKEVAYEEYMEDFRNSLCIFPFFVMVWFNSEDNDKLIDKCFPTRFLKNTLKYYSHYLKDICHS